jgi:hemerythrin-like domain-containing protein
MMACLLLLLIQQVERAMSSRIFVYLSRGEFVMQRTSQRTTQKSSHKTAKKTTAKTARTRKPAVQDAIGLLMDDHKRVQKIFKDFEKVKSKGDLEMKAELVRTACHELTIHAQLEEELVYPVLREALKEKTLIDEAAVEHGTAKQFISELESMDPNDELYDAKFLVLGEYINHHIKEEEKEIFPKAKKAKVDFMSIGEEIRHRKESESRGEDVRGDVEPEEAMQSPSEEIPH